MRSLVLALDDRFLQPFEVMWHSLMATRSVPEGTPVHVLHEDSLSGESMQAVRSLIGEGGFEVDFVDTSQVLPQALPNIGYGHVSRATYYRLFIATLFPKTVESVVYLDIDILAIGSVRELFEVTLTAPVAAVSHFSPQLGMHLWGPSGGGYFQAGVLVADLRRWRSESWQERFMVIMRDEADRIKYWDQDVLNLAFERAWQPLPWWFNVVGSVISCVKPAPLKEQARLIHFDGPDKPWLVESDHPFFHEWHRIRRQARGEDHAAPRRPRLVWPRSMKDVVRRLEFLARGA